VVHGKVNQNTVVNSHRAARVRTNRRSNLATKCGLATVLCPPIKARVRAIGERVAGENCSGRRRGDQSGPRTKPAAIQPASTPTHWTGL